jgi:hypothetical protein
MYTLKFLKKNFLNLALLSFKETANFSVDSKDKIKESDSLIEKSDEQKDLEEKLDTIEKSLKFLK